MTDAQTWTLIGGFVAVTAAMNTLMLRVVRTEIQALGYRFDAVNTRFDSLDARIDGIDRDVAMLVQRAIDD